MALVVGLGTGSARAAAQICQGAEIRTFTRDFTTWFGTLSVAGASAPSQHFLQLSDRLSDGLIFQVVHDASIDDRARSITRGGPWNNIGQTNVEWVTGTPPANHFPAQGNLLDAYAAAAASLAGLLGPGVLALGATSAATTRNYAIDCFVSVEPRNGVVVNVANHFVAHASYFQQNAVWTLSNQNPNPTIAPEPGTLSLLGAGLLLSAIVRMRRASTGP